MQKIDETFTDYIARWRAKVTQMRNRLDTKEQIKIFIKGTLPVFREKLYYMPLTKFSQVYEVGTACFRTAPKRPEKRVLFGFCWKKGDFYFEQMVTKYFGYDANKSVL